MGPASGSSNFTICKRGTDERFSWGGRLLLVILLAAFSARGIRAQPHFPFELSSALAAFEVQQAGKPQSPSPPDPGANPQSSGPAPALAPAASVQSSDGSKGEQTKRILWLIPNFQSVSADTYLPPLSLKEKFWLATQDSFDYTSFAVVAAQAGINLALNSNPEFHHGARGYGRYYWHEFTDQAAGNYMTEAIFPAVLHEDPRYYTLFHGNFFRRAGYAVSRLFITRNDAGRNTFNISEIFGNGAAAALSDFYYPGQERTWSKTSNKWFTQLGLDGATNIFQEFWPDIRHGLFHR